MNRGSAKSGIVSMRSTCIIFGCLLLTSSTTGLQLLHATGGHRTSRLSAVANPEITAAKPVQAAEPPPKVFPCGDALDKKILGLAGPAICNFLILPITQSVDLFFIGKLNSALAIAGQAAANQVFSSAAWIVSVIPTVTVPRVAKAKAAGDMEEVQRAVGEAIFIAVILSTLLAVAVGLCQQAVLVAAGSAAALPFSLPYLLYRLPGLVAESVSTIGFSAFRGVLDTVTPLKITLWSCAVNCICDPAFMFAQLRLPGGLMVKGLGLGIAGAALATTASQLFAAVAYLRLLLKKKLVAWHTLLRPPPKASLLRLAKAGGAVQVRMGARTRRRKPSLRSLAAPLHPQPFTLSPSPSALRPQPFTVSPSSPPCQSTCPTRAFSIAGMPASLATAYADRASPKASVCASILRRPTRTASSP